MSKLISIFDVEMTLKDPLKSTLLFNLKEMID